MQISLSTLGRMKLPNGMVNQLNEMNDAVTLPTICNQIEQGIIGYFGIQEKTSCCSIKYFASLSKNDFRIDITTKLYKLLGTKSEKSQSKLTNPFLIKSAKLILKYIEIRRSFFNDISSSRLLFLSKFIDIIPHLDMKDNYTPENERKLFGVCCALFKLSNNPQIWRSKNIDGVGIKKVLNEIGINISYVLVTAMLANRSRKIETEVDLSSDHGSTIGITLNQLGSEDILYKRVLPILNAMHNDSKLTILISKSFCSGYTVNIIVDKKQFSIPYDDIKDLVAKENRHGLLSDRTFMEATLAENLRKLGIIHNNLNKFQISFTKYYKLIKSDVKTININDIIKCIETMVPLIDDLLKNITKYSIEVPSIQRINSFLNEPLLKFKDRLLLLKKGFEEKSMLERDKTTKLCTAFTANRSSTNSAEFGEFSELSSRLEKLIYSGRVFRLCADTSIKNSNEAWQQILHEINFN